MREACYFLLLIAVVSLQEQVKKGCCLLTMFCFFAYICANLISYLRKRLLIRNSHAFTITFLTGHGDGRAITAG